MEIIGIIPDQGQGHTAAATAGRPDPGGQRVRLPAGSLARRGRRASHADRRFGGGALLRRQKRAAIARYLRGPR